MRTIGIAILLMTMTCLTIAKYCYAETADTSSAAWSGNEQVANITGKSTVNGAVITWNAVPGADGYLIGAIQNGQPYRQIGYTSATQYLDSNASYEKYSFYWVFPYKKVNGRVMRGGVSATYAYGIKQLPAPALQAASEPDHVQLTWNSIPGAFGYTILVRRGNGNTTKLCDVAGTEFADNNVAYGETSYYWVYAYAQDPVNGNRRPGAVSRYVYGTRTEEIKPDIPPMTPGTPADLPAGHTWVIFKDWPVTCANATTTIYACKDCGMAYVIDKPAGPHSYQVTPMTGLNGVTYNHKICTVCGHEEEEALQQYTYEVVLMNRHRLTDESDVVIYIKTNDPTGNGLVAEWPGRTIYTQYRDYKDVHYLYDAGSTLPHATAHGFQQVNGGYTYTVCLQPGQYQVTIKNIVNGIETVIRTLTLDIYSANDLKEQWIGEQLHVLQGMYSDNKEILTALKKTIAEQYKYMPNIPIDDSGNREIITLLANEGVCTDTKLGTCWTFTELMVRAARQLGLTANPQAAGYALHEYALVDFPDGTQEKYDVPVYQENNRVRPGEWDMMIP